MRQVCPLDKAAEAMDAQETTTLASLELALTSGILQAKAGRDAIAESAYRRVAAQALDLRPAHGKDAEDLYRMACVRLSRLYRRTGRSREAQFLAEQVKMALPASS